MKTYLIGAIIALAVSLGTVWVVGSHTPPPSPAPTFGALAGPDIASPYLRWGGIIEWHSAMNMGLATTTTCALQSPAATSTLAYAFANFATATTTAQQVTWAKAVNAFATTTLLSYSTLASGIKGAVFATTTLAVNSAVANAAVDPALVFAPNTWLVLGVAGVNIATNQVSLGTCQAAWIGLPDQM